jgi:hypothetical protein
MLSSEIEVRYKGVAYAVCLTHKTLITHQNFLNALVIVLIEVDVYKNLKDAHA